MGNMGNDDTAPHTTGTAAARALAAEAPKTATPFSTARGITEIMRVNQELRLLSQFVDLRTKAACTELSWVRIDQGEQEWEHDGVARLDVTSAVAAIQEAERALGTARRALLSLVGEIHRRVVELDEQGVPDRAVVLPPLLDVGLFVDRENRGKAGVERAVPSGDGGARPDPEVPVVGAQQEAGPLAALPDGGLHPTNGVREDVNGLPVDVQSGCALAAHDASPSAGGGETHSVGAGGAVGASNVEAPTGNRAGSDR